MQIAIHIDFHKKKTYHIVYRKFLTTMIIGINSLTSHKSCESLYFKRGYRFPNEFSQIKRNRCGRMRNNFEQRPN